MSITVAMALVALAAPPTIENVGTLAGGTFSRAAAVSADGQFVSGIADLRTDKLFGDRAFRWSTAGGIQSLGVPSGLVWTAGNSISSTGDAVAGNATNRMFRWTQAGGMQNLGTLPGGTLALAYGVSDAAATVVGMSNSPTGFWAVRWTQPGGLQNMGALPGGTSSVAYAVNPSGDTIVGGSGWSGAGQHAFMWTQAGGMVDMHISSSMGSESYATAVSSAGTSLAGDMILPAGRRGWVRQGITGFLLHSLAPTAGATDIAVRGLNGAGHTAVGYVVTPGGRRAFVWDFLGGVRDLNTYIPTLGLPLTGWVLQEATGINGDGSVIVGYGAFNGLQRGFVLRNVPCVSVPVFSAHPGGSMICPGGAASMSVAVISASPATFEWEWAVFNGPPYQFSPVVDGYNGLVSNPRFYVDPGGSTLPTLIIQGVSGTEPLLFRARAENRCGLSRSSFEAVIRICPGDTNCDGQVDFNDYLEFLNLFNALDPRADLNQDSIVDFNDYLEFLNLYNVGC